MFEGVCPPIPTPFVDGEVAHDKLTENLARWNQTDLAGTADDTPQRGCDGSLRHPRSQGSSGSSGFLWW